jgi:uncharacterized membrane protein
MMGMRRFISPLLSLLVPGLGQLYNGDRPKGAALACMTAGVAGMAWMSRTSPLSLILLGIIYLFIVLPAVRDAYQQAAGTARPTLENANTWYVLLMLASVGPMATPLLWQNSRFSTRAKIFWTALVVLVFLSFLVLIRLLPIGLDAVEQYMLTFPPSPERDVVMEQLARLRDLL